MIATTIKRPLMGHSAQVVPRYLQSWQLQRGYGTGAPTVKLIEDRCEKIYNAVLKPVDTFNVVSQERGTLPMVMLLGNHSSGKSTFINYLLGCKEQETGVAPTDDAFTVVVKGKTHADQNGLALMTDDRWAFSELKNFGPKFLNHFSLKVRNLPENSLLPEGMMIVDTPGMIDTPLKQDQYRRDNRGYDFLKVVRWFAERSDAVLLLFDPNNPGTTGETLDVLTESLADLEHKMLVILNKVDQFTQVHDFARAYGSLCWNLAKVIRRKDIPRIYTMFTPTKVTSSGQSKPDLPNVKPSERVLTAADVTFEEMATSDKEISKRGIPLSDFNRTRDEVVAEILRAPQRRVDNMVTALEDAVSRLQIACQVSNVIRSQYRSKMYASYGATALSATAGPSVVAGCFYMGVPFSVGAGMCATAFAGLGYSMYVTQRAVLEHKEMVAGTLDTIFRRLYHKQVDEDFSLVACWESVKPKIIKSLQIMEMSEIPNVRKSTLTSLENLHQEVKDMRRQCKELRGIQVEEEPKDEPKDVAN